ncbi:dihydrodipicolinate synthase [Moritella sp. PE36]|nr:dihydrodipicolinate synthase [Moritella sp. PE36]
MGLGSLLNLVEDLVGEYIPKLLQYLPLSVCKLHMPSVVWLWLCLVGLAV